MGTKKKMLYIQFCRDITFVTNLHTFKLLNFLASNCDWWQISGHWYKRQMAPNTHTNLLHNLYLSSIQMWRISLYCLLILFFFLFCKNYVGAVEGGGQKPKIFMMDKKSAPGGKRWRTEAKMFSSSRWGGRFSQYIARIWKIPYIWFIPKKSAL